VQLLNKNIMRGRRTPTEVKKTQGTYQACRDNGVKIDTLDKMPAPSPILKLSKDAEGIWYGYGNQLIINGLMTFLDLVVFGRYCQFYDDCLIFQRDLNEKGLFQKSEKTGFEKARPQVKMLAATQTAMLKIEDRFGLSPNSRAKIPAQKKDNDGDDFDKALNE